jgi:membrane protein involved in colicin uptake
VAVKLGELRRRMKPVDAVDLGLEAERRAEEEAERRAEEEAARALAAAAAAEAATAEAAEAATAEAARAVAAATPVDFCFGMNSGDWHKLTTTGDQDAETVSGLLFKTYPRLSDPAEKGLLTNDIGELTKFVTAEIKTFVTDNHLDKGEDAENIEKLIKRHTKPHTKGR